MIPVVTFGCTFTEGFNNLNTDWIFSLPAQQTTDPGPGRSNGSNFHLFLHSHYSRWRRRNTVRKPFELHDHSEKVEKFFLLLKAQFYGSMEEESIQFGGFVFFICLLLAIAKLVVVPSSFEPNSKLMEPQISQT